jgi:hypothetical protein
MFLKFSLEKKQMQKAKTSTLKKYKFWLGIMVHIYTSSIWEGEQRVLRV